MRRYSRSTAFFALIFCGCSIILLAWTLRAGGTFPLSLTAATETFDFFSGGKTAARPTRLRIPAVHIDAPVADVGLTVDGAVEVPHSATTVGWFAPGFVPGTKGNSVIVGHLDTVAGVNAVFGNLHKLSAGDEVFVDMNDGSTLAFRVTQSTSYKANAAPLSRIFGAGTGKYLNLITCQGTWFTVSGYDKRLVVYTELE